MIVAASSVALAQEPSPASGASADYTTSSNVAVLRQKVSVPLEQLVQPVSLDEWLREQQADISSLATDSSSASPAVPAADATSGPRDDPFADDPEPASTAHAGAADSSDSVVTTSYNDQQPTGKIPSGKLLRILGRALQRSAPVPSVDGLRDKIPSWAVPQMHDDPLNGPPVDAEAAPVAPAENAETDEEDPFGGF